MDLRVSRIYVYPIKSCGGVKVDEWPLEMYGFRYDRIWAVFSEDGLCVTQLEEPKMCLIQPEINLSKGKMTLTYAGNVDETPMTVDLETSKSGNSKKGKISWGGSLEGIDCGEEVAAWLSFNLDVPGLRLIRCTARNPPKANEFGMLDPKVMAASQCQYLLTTESTVKWLMNELEDDNGAMDFDNVLYRFRSNILIAGHLPANSEVNWTEVTIGGTKFPVDTVCVRCRMVNIDQSSAEKNQKPLRVLDHNKQKGKSVFGIYLKCEKPTGSVVRVGQSVDVTYE
ncbi:molybdenum cofactor sulfurase-like [Adelges cooleyi]|uniref:molybdenum cofactor sulfurase-like n=1 Tax=Adelges cooleyi TaxID=133065 RepID=UPI00217F4088|nr:molybdenum cofactor sulfurase-like [Adelges cooleyi]